MKQYYESAAVQFFGLFNMLTMESCSETGIFRHLIKHVFNSL